MTATIAVFGTTTEASAQICKRCKCSGDREHTIFLPPPHRSVRPNRQMPVSVSYDESSTILTVYFSQYSDDSTVEVFHNGAKVTGITAGGGTTFSCILKDYGLGDYDIIVSRGNTVVYSRNIIVR